MIFGGSGFGNSGGRSKLLIYRAQPAILGNQEGHKNQQPLTDWETKKKHTLSLETSKSRKEGNI